MTYACQRQSYKSSKHGEVIGVRNGPVMEEFKMQGNSSSSYQNV